MSVICPDCGAEMTLRSTAKYKTRDGKDKMFYGCSRFPNCRAIHGAHPDGKPLGIPGNQETKAARIKAHAAMDKVVQERGWGKDAKDPRARRGLYLWLGRKMGFEEREIAEKCHIAMFDVNQCQRVIEICVAADPERKDA